MAQTADVERAKAEVVAIQAAIKVQLQTLGAALKNAQAVREQRIAEKENETKGKASAEKAVEELKGQNAELTDQLTQLRNEFKAVLQSNRALVDRLLKSPAPRRVTRPAAFAR
jgi:small-conductance mechanosensitive channel